MAKQQAHFRLEPELLKGLREKAKELGITQTELLSQFIREGLKVERATDQSPELAALEEKVNKNREAIEELKLSIGLPLFDKTIRENPVINITSGNHRHTSLKDKIPVELKRKLNDRFLELLKDGKSLDESGYTWRPFKKGGTWMWEVKKLDTQ